ncbi:18089_t:CDS:2 [Racocetra fulgida]|uniref:18089_t:CDS:1 n=1 Tax=Racocetra fulgida TaxID=60492 RepID=A0A9N8ZJT4_9GLOM|nr:18089_t:CDS:2 [Racocetra fulgida]
MTQYQETDTFPQNPIIKAQTKTNSFSYEIIQEGYYPLSPILVYTFPPNKYKIPDKYIVKTIFGKRSNQQIIKCSINYINNKPLYHIEFEDQVVESKKSTSEAANLYKDILNKIAKLKNLIKLCSSTRFNGIEIFGLQLQNIKKIRENKHRKHNLKPFNQLANSSQKIQWLISEMRAKITAEMSQAIKVYTFNFEELIDNESFYEKENYKIEKEIYRSLKDILNYTIPAWLENGGLSIQDPVLRIRLSGDGRNKISNYGNYGS